jgi:tetratricopeptide (TPR) repeat protein
VAQDQRDFEVALAMFDEALEVAKQIGDRNRTSVILTNIGEVKSRMGQPTEAIAVLKQAEDLCDELGDKLGLAEALRGLGKAYLAQRDYAKARSCTARAVELFREVQSKVQVGVALRSLGEVTAAGNPGVESSMQARGHLLQSIAIFEEIGNEIELARSYRAYAELLKASPEFQTDPAVMKEAAEFVRRADDISAKLKISSFGLRPEAFFGTR